MPFYESVFIARQDIATPQVDSLTDNIEKILSDQGGSVSKREYWGLRTLAHKIKKNRKGHYVLLNIDAPAPAIQEMERQMRINEDVLRYLTVRLDELEEGPSIIMRSRSSDDRPRRGPRDEGGDSEPTSTGASDAVAASEKPVVQAEETAETVAEAEEPVVEAEAEEPAAEEEGDEK